MSVKAGGASFYPSIPSTKSETEAVTRQERRNGARPSLHVITEKQRKVLRKMGRLETVIQQLDNRLAGTHG